MLKSKTLSGYEMKIPQILSKYRVIEYLGSGSFSVVYKVQKISLHKEFSAKIISMEDMKKQDFKESINNEINILKKIDHPNIIKFIESFTITNDKKEDLFVIITDFCSNGNLHEYMNIMGYLDKEDIKVINKGIAEAIRYLHSIGIAHCDIKLNNILLDDNFNPKLCDFNLSKNVKMADPYEECGGTFPYSAPEVYEEGPIDFYKTDIYSLGIAIYEISEACLPFIENENGELITCQLAIETENKELKSLIEKCTKFNPNERINAEQIFQESYFKNMNQNYNYIEKDSYDNDYDSYGNYSHKINKYNYY